MKKVIFILTCIFLINSINCFSQSVEKNKKKFKTKTKYVYGYSDDFDELYLGIAFGKVISLADTAFYVEIHLSAPDTEFRTDIHINKASAITFLSKSGKTVDLKLTDVNSSSKYDKQIDYPIIKPNTTKSYSTTLILDVTKEKLIEIGSEPFHNLILPYFNSSTKVNSKAVFVKPTLFIRRSFIQKNVNYILNI